jgi:hypothetical protein
MNSTVYTVRVYWRILCAESTAAAPVAHGRNVQKTAESLLRPMAESIILLVKGSVEGHGTSLGREELQRMHRGLSQAAESFMNMALGFAAKTSNAHIASSIRESAAGIRRGLESLGQTIAEVRLGDDAQGVAVLSGAVAIVRGTAATLDVFEQAIAEELADTCSLAKTTLQLTMASTTMDRLATMSRKMQLVMELLERSVDARRQEVVNTSVRQRYGNLMGDVRAACVLLMAATKLGIKHPRNTGAPELVSAARRLADERVDWMVRLVRAKQVSLALQSDSTSEREAVVWQSHGLLAYMLERMASALVLDYAPSIHDWLEVLVAHCVLLGDQHDEDIRPAAFNLCDELKNLAFDLVEAVNGAHEIEQLAKQAHNSEDTMAKIALERALGQEIIQVIARTTRERLHDLMALLYRGSARRFLEAYHTAVVLGGQLQGLLEHRATAETDSRGTGAHRASVDVTASLGPSVDGARASGAGVTAAPAASSSAQVWVEAGDVRHWVHMMQTACATAAASLRQVLATQSRSRAMQDGWYHARIVSDYAQLLGPAAGASERYRLDGSEWTMLRVLVDESQRHLQAMQDAWDSVCRGSAGVTCFGTLYGRGRRE